MRFPRCIILAATAFALLAARAEAEEAAPHTAPSKNERALTDAQREAVLNKVRSCWHAPAGETPPGLAVTLLVIVNEESTVLDATIVPEDQDRMDTPAMRAFARSALAAITDPRCARLDMPNGNLGRPWLFRLRFTG